MTAQVRGFLVLACLVLLPALGSSQSVRKSDDALIEFFEKKVRPILANNCFNCHSANTNSRGGLRLDDRNGILEGGKRGPAVIPGQPEKSLLMGAVRRTHAKVKMPPEKPLAAEAVADLAQWIKDGAAWPKPVMPASLGKYKEKYQKLRKEHWAWQALKDPKAPAVKDAAWPRDDVDRFVLARLEAKGLAAVAAADPATLVRRVTFDLTGLPPSPADIDAFLEDSSPEAFARIVDRLLASPAFGERWGRHWLDVARYAESTGPSRNLPYPQAWRYRDYVLDAFNSDKPFDRFVLEQLAGDLLPAASPQERDSQLIATGFLALGVKDVNQRFKVRFTMDNIDEQIDTVTRALLGLTASCARCHDHKFDPIPATDYYALAGIFHSSDHCSGLRNKMGGGGLDYYDPAMLLTLGGNGKDSALGVRDAKKIGDTALRIRGEAEQLGPVIPRGFLTIYDFEGAPRINPSQSGRLELAQWLVHRNNPLTPRVLVNRLWQHLFGQGLVLSVDNFGVTGTSPSHPELLDHLANRLIQEQWSLKKMIRVLVLTRAYQLGTDAPPSHVAVDPDNRLVWRHSPRRLDAEEIRDAMLAVAGKLDPARPKGSPAQELKVVELRSDGPEAKRFEEHAAKSMQRSVYLPLLRGLTPRALEVFDFAEQGMVTGSRDATTVAPQALYLLNDPFVMQQAGFLGQRLLAQKDLDQAGRIRLAYRLAYGRSPTVPEIDRVRQYLGAFQADGKETAQAAWTSFAQALFAAAEFRFCR